MSSMPVHDCPGTRPPDPPAPRHSRPALAVHVALRREFRLAGGLVRAVSDRGVNRAVIVADHLALLLRCLEHHHHLEDALVWPLLRERVVAAECLLLDTMESQHETIDMIVRRVTAMSDTFRSRPGTVREELAAALDELAVVLDDHLDLEERRALPLAESYLTPDEWGEIGRQGEPEGTPAERLVVFGMIQYAADPAVIADMLRPAPLPVRIALPRLSRRAYRRHSTAVHGTPTP